MTIDGEIGDEHLSEQYHVKFDPKSEPASDAVVSSLAEATGTDPDELESIESVVDPIVFDADESPSHGVVRAIAAVKGIEPTDVDPLYDFINPDALDPMFDDATETGESDTCVSFRIDDLEVEVSGDRRITVRPVTAVA